LKLEKACAYPIFQPNYSFLPGDMQKAFFKVLRFASHWPAAQGKVSLFLYYPALTSQHGARAAPRWLDVLGYSLPPLTGAGVSLV